jgi:plastocyanin
MKTTKFVILTLSLALLFIFVGCAAKEVVPVEIPAEAPVEEIIEETVKEVMVKETGNELTIEVTKEGFSPNSLTVSVGDTVTFVSKDAQKHWPATDVHPTHTNYPESNINRCRVAQEGEMFDACRGLNEEETFSFKFNAVGKWAFHDHLNPRSKGMITVE